MAAGKDFGMPPHALARAVIDAVRHSPAADVRPAARPALVGVLENADAAERLGVDRDITSAIVKEMVTEAREVHEEVASAHALCEDLAHKTEAALAKLAAARK